MDNRIENARSLIHYYFIKINNFNDIIIDVNKDLDLLKKEQIIISENELILTRKNKYNYNIHKYNSCRQYKSRIYRKIKSCENKIQLQIKKILNIILFNYSVIYVKFSDINLKYIYIDILKNQGILTFLNNAVNEHHKAITFSKERTERSIALQMNNITELAKKKFINQYY